MTTRRGMDIISEPRGEVTGRADDAIYAHGGSGF